MKYLIKISLLSFKNRISALKFSEDLKAAFFLFIGINLAIIIYGASYWFLKYVNSTAVAGPLIVNKLLALFFLTAFMMTVLSCAVVSFSSLYFSKDVRWLLSSPISYKSVFAFKALAALFYASWMVFAASVPFIAALGAVKNAPAYFYAGAAALIVPFLASAGFIGSSFSVIVMKFFPAAKIRNIIFVAGALFFTVLLVIVRLVRPEKFISSDGFEQLSQYLSYLDAPTAGFLPSWWYSAALMSLIAGNAPKILFYSLLLFSAAGAAFAVLKFLGGKYYLDGLNEGQAFARVKNSGRNFSKRSPVFALLVKDFKVFFRDCGQWSQVLILASIVVVYLFSMHKLSSETLKMHNIMAVVNCALVWFVAAAAALRLSFPLISLEGESFWFLLSSPVSRLKLFAEKVVFGSVPVFLTSIILISSVNYMMSVSPPAFILTLTATVFVSLLISCAAVSAGSILPKFNYSSIAEIESSLGGLVFMLFAFFMIIVDTIVIMQPVRVFYSGENFGDAFVRYGIFIAVFNLLAVSFVLFAGYNALKRLEK
jgi:hypothetical protein